jgi:sugar phosphate isomerase/epimerase
LKLAAFTDEISPDPVRAIALAAQWGIAAVEVRGLPGGRFPAVDNSVLEDFGRRVNDAGLQVSAVSPGFFKCLHDDPSVEKTLKEGLPRACQWAQNWGTDLVSVFAFRGGKGSPPTAITDLLGRMADTAQAAGCRLVLENEAVCWGATGDEAAALLRRVAHSNLGLCWDPGNAARAGAVSPFPDEYQGLKDLIQHLHLKNFDPSSGEWSLMQEGMVDWPGHFAALAADGYASYAVIETHLKTAPEHLPPLPGLTPLESNSKRNLDYIRTHAKGL